MFPEKNKFLKKFLIVFFLCLAFVILLIEMTLSWGQLYVWKLELLKELKTRAELLVSPLDYNPVETLNVEEATVAVYFSPDVRYYQGKVPNPQKHRIVRYNAALTNTGRKEKNFILVELFADPEFRNLISDPWGPPGSLPVSCAPIKSLPPGSKASIPCDIEGLAEGDPAEIERLAYQSKLRILWTEDGKKREKIIEITPKK